MKGTVVTSSPKRLAARSSARSEIEFKRALVEAREAAGFSQRGLAAVMGVSHSTVSRMERLDSDPSLSSLRQYLTQCSAALSLDVVPQTVFAEESRRHHERAVAKARAVDVIFNEDISLGDQPLQVRQIHTGASVR